MLELLGRLEVLVDHTRILRESCFVDKQDEVSSARRENNAIVGPTRVIDRSEVLEKNDRGVLKEQGIGGNPDIPDTQKP